MQISAKKSCVNLVGQPQSDYNFQIGQPSHIDNKIKSSWVLSQKKNSILDCFKIILSK